jgi:hypothetical protein
MSALLRILFADKLDEDTREPILTFSITSSGAEYGLLAPSLSFWVQMAALLVLQSILCNALAAVVYCGIIQRRGTSTAYLIGYGFVMPFVVAMPFYLIQALDLRNTCFMVAVASTPVLLTFRCLEAMHGFSPPAVEARITNYMLYYGSVIEFVFDGRTNHAVRSTTAEALTKARRFLAFYLFLALLFSALEPCAYAPIDMRPRGASGHAMEATIGDFLHPGHLANNFAVAYVTHVCLHTGTLGFGSAISLLAGIKTMDIANNPFFSSSSPSDFWGRRWNCLVHGVLKRGVYKPVRSISENAAVAAIATFVASGFLHEYILAIISMDGKGEGTSSGVGDDKPVRYGMHLAFFAYNAIIFTLEHLLGEAYIFKVAGRTLHPTIISLCVVCSVLPIAHWFTDEYKSTGFYSDYKVGFPIIVSMNR